jgi:hypothetical protein
MEEELGRRSGEALPEGDGVGVWNNLLVNVIPVCTLKLLPSVLMKIRRID